MTVYLYLLTLMLVAQEPNAISLPPATTQAPAPVESPRMVTVTLEIPILNNDALAARDNSQSQAFEKALDQALPQSLSPATRSQRIKSAIRYVKSFRVTDEHRVGDSLKISYEVEIQESAFEADPKQAVPPVPSQTQAGGDEIALEIVLLTPFNAAETVDQIENQLKIPVTSFRLTRSAILLRVKAVKSAEVIQQELQTFVGSRGRVNLVPVSVPPAPPAVSTGTP